MQAAAAPPPQAQEPVYAPPPQPAPVSGGMSADQIDRLKELAALRDQGILTEEEFAAQKAQILE
jgi:hypothetical protein